MYIHELVNDESVVDLRVSFEEALVYMKEGKFVF